MKFPGAFYQEKGKLYLAVYSFYPDIYTMLPPELKATYQAHVAYKMQGKSGGIDVFQITDESKVGDFVEARKRFTLKDNSITKSEGSNVLPITLSGLEEVDKRHDVQYEFLTGNEQTGLLDLIRADIGNFCEGKPAKKTQGSSRIYVSEIIPHTQLRRMNVEHLLSGGKQWFVDSCILEANLDFSRGCITGWVPGDKTSFDGQTATDYFLYPWGECRYCYADDKHQNFPKHLIKIDRDQLKRELLGECCLEYGTETQLGRPVKVLRLGKRTEACTPFTLDEFATTLETCVDTETQCVIPTKFLKFDPQIASLLKKTNSVLLYSIGFPELEKGALMWGCDNEFRQEQASRFNEAGVNSVLYLNILGHKPPGKRELDSLTFAKQHGLKVQLLPTRLRSRHLVDIFPNMDGLSWDDLRANANQGLLVNHDANGVRGRYDITGGGKLTLDTFDPAWLELTGKNDGDIRICHHNSTNEYCGGCFLRNGFKREITTQKQLKSPAKDSPKNPRRESREVRSRSKELFVGQETLGLE